MPALRCHEALEQGLCSVWCCPQNNIFFFSPEKRKVHIRRTFSIVGFLFGSGEFLTPSKGDQQFHCYMSGSHEKTYRDNDYAVNIKVKALTASTGTISTRGQAPGAWSLAPWDNHRKNQVLLTSIWWGLVWDGVGVTGKAGKLWHRERQVQAWLLGGLEAATVGAGLASWPSCADLAFAELVVKQWAGERDWRRDRESLKSGHACHCRSYGHTTCGPAAKSPRVSWALCWKEDTLDWP